MFSGQGGSKKVGNIDKMGLIFLILGIFISWDGNNSGGGETIFAPIIKNSPPPPSLDFCNTSLLETTTQLKASMTRNDAFRDDLYYLRTRVVKNDIQCPDFSVQISESKFQFLDFSVQIAVP